MVDNCFMKILRWKFELHGIVARTKQSLVEDLIIMLTKIKFCFPFYKKHDQFLSKEETANEQRWRRSPPKEATYNRPSHL